EGRIHDSVASVAERILEPVARRTREAGGFVAEPWLTMFQDELRAEHFFFGRDAVVVEVDHVVCVEVVADPADLHGEGAVTMSEEIPRSGETAANDDVAVLSPGFVLFVGQEGEQNLGRAVDRSRYALRAGRSRAGDGRGLDL